MVKFIIHLNEEYDGKLAYEMLRPDINRKMLKKFLESFAPKNVVAIIALGLKFFGVPA